MLHVQTSSTDALCKLHSSDIMQQVCRKSSHSLHFQNSFYYYFFQFFYIGTFFKIQKQVLQVNTSILGITSLWEFTISQRVSPFIPAPVAQGAGPTLNLGPPLWKINKWATPSPFTHCRYAAPRDIQRLPTTLFPLVLSWERLVLSWLYQGGSITAV
jgi:hypothetical protein